MARHSYTIQPTPKLVLATRVFFSLDSRSCRNSVVHVEDEPVIGEFHQDPDSDSSGDDDSETD